MKNDGSVDRQRIAGAGDTATKAKRRRSDTHMRDAEPQIGRALRSVYDQTVGEAIPAEMLDLLGKLD